MEKFELSHAQQVPKPPAPGPGNIPPLQPDIPVPDPAPPPIENPGDQPFPPITDPDVNEPGDPNPAHTPMRMRGLKRKTPLQGHPRLKPVRTERTEQLISKFRVGTCSDGGELGDQSNTGGTKPSASANDLTPQNWSEWMMSVKPEDFAADLAVLRDDVAKLTSSVSDFIRAQGAAASNTVFDAAGNARQKVSDTASKAQDVVTGASRDLETTIERNPLAAVLIAMVAGLFIGIFGGAVSRK